MPSFKKDNLVLLNQGIGGSARQWAYHDTGALIADLNEISGYFTVGYDMGMRHGDMVTITEGDTGTFDTSGRATGGRKHHTATVLIALDTGTTQVTLGTAVKVSDTS